MGQFRGPRGAGHEAPVIIAHKGIPAPITHDLASTGYGLVIYLHALITQCIVLP